MKGHYYQQYLGIPKEGTRNGINELLKQTQFEGLEYFLLPIDSSNWLQYVIFKEFELFCIIIEESIVQSVKQPVTYIVSHNVLQIISAYISLIKLIH